LVTIWVLGGCQSTTRVGDRYYQNGRYVEAAAAFQAYLDADPSDKAKITHTLYRLGVIFATPGSRAYEPRRSIDVLEQLIADYPGSPYTAEAVLLRNLQLKISDLRAELAQTRVRLTELEVDLAERASKLDALEQQVDEKDEQITTLQESIPPLRLEIGHLIDALAITEQELEQLDRLKAIDLDQPPP